MYMYMFFSMKDAHAISHGASSTGAYSSRARSSSSVGDVVVVHHVVLVNVVVVVLYIVRLSVYVLSRARCMYVCSVLSAVGGG